jgi:hypothetical protein
MIEYDWEWLKMTESGRKRLKLVWSVWSDWKWLNEIDTDWKLVNVIIVIERDW